MLISVFLQFVIFFIADRFAPLVGGILSGDLCGDMGEPAAFLRAMPMLDFRRNSNDCTVSQRHRRFPRLLIPPFTGGSDQQLAAAFFRVVDMPVIPASRLKGDICQKKSAFRLRQGIQIRLPAEIPGIGRVFRPKAKHILLGECFLIYYFHGVLLVSVCFFL